MHTETLLSALDPLLDDGSIVEVFQPLKSGKEATVYLCQAGPRAGGGLAVAKVYRPAEHRGFHNDALYREGRVIRDARVRRAVGTHTRLGREAQAALWSDHEYQTLKLLRAAGADVPAPLAHAPGALLLELLGDESGPAPQLKDVRLPPEQARAVRDRLLENVALWLAYNVVHGDLSPFNTLWWQGQAWVIDLPQAVDPRFNPHAERLLRRDLQNLARYFERQGAGFDPHEVADDLWRWFLGGAA